MVFTFFILWLFPLLREREKKSKNICLKKKNGIRRSEEQLGLDRLLLSKSILHKQINSIFHFAYKLQLNYTYHLNVPFKWAIALLFLHCFSKYICILALLQCWFNVSDLRLQLLTLKNLLLWNQKARYKLLPSLSIAQNSLTQGCKK